MKNCPIEKRSYFLKMTFLTFLVIGVFIGVFLLKKILKFTGTIFILNRETI